MKRSFFLILGMALVLFLFIGTTDAQTLRIVPDDYSTIQAAVDVSVDGDIIYVRAGIYPESVQVIGFTSLTIKAEGAGHDIKSVIVDPTPGGSTIGFNVISDGVTVEGFEICDTNFGIWFEGSNNKFSNNYIHNIASTFSWDDGGVGISLWDVDGDSNYNSITNNVIENIERTGVLLDVTWTPYKNSGNSIVNNKFKNCDWGAIEAINSENSSFNRNVIQECGNWGITLFSYGIAAGSNTIAHNDIQNISPGNWDWGVGIFIWGLYGTPAEENDIHHNKIDGVVGATGWGQGIRIDADNNVVHHNKVTNATPEYLDNGSGNKDFRNSWN